MLLVVETGSDFSPTSMNLAAVICRTSSPLFLNEMYVEASDDLVSKLKCFLMTFCYSIRNGQKSKAKNIVK